MIKLTLSQQYSVTTKASAKTFEEINRFREEVEAIRLILTLQLDKLKDLLGIFFAPPPSIDPPWAISVKRSSRRGAETIRHSYTERMREQIHQRLDMFDELKKQANRIQELVSVSTLSWCF